jgi:hypothetical protein
MSGYGYKIFINIDHINLLFENPGGSSLKKKKTKKEKNLQVKFSLHTSQVIIRCMKRII